jgi:hypothetical protein
LATNVPAFVKLPALDSVTEFRDMTRGIQTMAICRRPRASSLARSIESCVVGCKLERYHNFMSFRRRRFFSHAFFLQRPSCFVSAPERRMSDGAKRPISLAIEEVKVVWASLNSVSLKNH